MKTYWNYNEGDLDESDSDKGLLQIEWFRWHGDRTPQKVFVVHDIIGQQVRVIDHWKMESLRILQWHHFIT